MSYKLIALCTFIVPCYAPPTYVIIDNMVGTIDPYTSCKVTDWAHKLESRCVCALLQQAPEVKKKQISAQQAINFCITQRDCDAQTIEQLKREYQSQNKPLEEFIEELYQKSLLIQEVPFVSSAKWLSAQQVKALLETAYKTGKLSHPDFKDVNCFEAQPERGGAFTTQLFIITSSCSVPPGKKYVLKEGWLDDVDMVIQASMIPHILEFKDEQINPQFPRVIFPEAYFSYKESGKTKPHTFSLMTAASGLPFDTLPDDILPEAFNQLGFQMAHFYQRFMEPVEGKIFTTTVTHGDMSGRNMFYNPTTKQITLIDNATMSRRNAAAIGNDLWATLGFFKKFKTATLFVEIVEQLLNGYVRAYAAESLPFKRQLLTDLSKILRNVDSNIMKPIVSSLITALEKNSLPLTSMLQSFARDFTALQGALLAP